MSAAHTPGPWKWSKAHNGLTYIYDAKGRVIARVFRPAGMSQGEQQANARLIAAAPELLNSLILMVRTHDEPAETLLQETKEMLWLEQARSVIAKATGQEGGAK
jgi:hypothetical protein